MKIYSKINSTKLLHIVVSRNDITNGRQDVIDEDNFLQCSILNLNKGKTFRPHKHIWKERLQNKITQESWVVISGSVKVSFYDTNDELIKQFNNENIEFSLITKYTSEKVFYYYILFLLLYIGLFLIKKIQLVLKSGLMILNVNAPTEM